MELAKTKITTKSIASVGVLSGIAVVLMILLEFPIPFMPPFLQVDFSNIPVLIGAFAFGPVTGICIGLVKAMLHLFVTSTGGVGELADFMTCAALVGTASLIYQRNKTIKNAVIGVAVGSVLMALVGGLANQFILIPFYSNVMPLEQIFEICGKINPWIHDIKSYVLYGAIPFNFVKAAIICIPTLLIYKRISRIIKK